jgi:cation diffusion facilitator family transporter
MTEPVTDTPVERAARLSVLTSVLVLALKIVAWRVTHSIALGSDALESIVNVVAAVAMWGAVRVAQRPPDEDHPFGHGKVEYLSAVLEGMLVLAAAVAIVHEAWPRLWHPVAAESFGAGVTWSLVATLCNAALGTFLVRTGRHNRSPALEADGRHVLTDVVTSVGVLIGFVAAKITGYWILDGILACIVASLILVSGWNVVRRSVGGLMDETVNLREATELRELISQIATQGGALEVHAFRVRNAGARSFCDVHMVVPGEMTVEVAHTLCDEVEAVVAKQHPYVDITIHVEPPEA